jgi:NADPH:quinone reductase-like Zn-dependent oxidoreductase
VPHLAAATSLLREILNRTPGSRLLASASGRVGVLLVELAGHLGRVSCARLTVGAANATAAKVDLWSAGATS